jgi:hypothetical protein
VSPLIQDRDQIAPGLFFTLKTAALIVQVAHDRPKPVDMSWIEPAIFDAALGENLCGDLQ